MTETVDREEFADYLRMLKNRTGRSYDALAGRLGISTSTLHRYCSGQQLPPEYTVIEHVARECGADRQELTRLRYLWVRATGISGDPGEPTGTFSERPPAVPATGPGDRPPPANAPDTAAITPSLVRPSRRSVSPWAIVALALLVGGFGAGWAVGHSPAKSAESSRSLPPDAAPPVTTTIQDTSVGAVRYRGASWTRCGDGGGCVPTQDHSYYYGYTPGDGYTLRFSGTRIKVFAPTDRDGGVAHLTLDGTPAGDVDFRAPSLDNGLRWTSAVLAAGNHEVTFTISATNRRTNVVLFDRAEVTTGR